ncbi:hypothetical protein [Globicatella sanguinis]
MSGLKRRLSTCLRPTQLCEGRPTKRKSFNFLLLAHSHRECADLGGILKENN